jgi:predicted lipoprotein with Yx(FWY)xxD motif
MLATVFSPTFGNIVILLNDVLLSKRKKTISMSQVFNRASSKSFLLKGSMFIILFSILAFRPSTVVHAFTQANGLYAGYFTGVNNVRGKFREVSVSFTVPAIKPTPLHSAVGIWVGLGGTGRFTSQVELVQAGISADWYPDQHKQKFGAWWEVIGKGKSVGSRPMDTDLPIQAGNQIRVDVSSNLNGDSKDTFRVTNVTTGQSATHQETDPTALSDSAAAECVLEAPSSGGELPLANFGTVTFTGCTTTDDQGNITPISAFEDQQQDSLYITDINDDSGVPITTTGPLENQATFNVTWKSTGATIVQPARVLINRKPEIILTNTKGSILYYSTADQGTATACTDTCTADWSPLLFKRHGAPFSSIKLPGELTVSKTANGQQVLYNGHLLYTYKNDTAPGQVKGNGVGGKWFPATPTLA